MRITINNGKLHQMIQLFSGCVPCTTVGAMVRSARHQDLVLLNFEPDTSKTEPAELVPVRWQRVEGHADVVWSVGWLAFLFRDSCASCYVLLAHARGNDIVILLVYPDARGLLVPQ